MDLTTRERLELIKNQAAQKKRKSKRRLGYFEEQLLRQFSNGYYRTVRNTLQKTICERLVNLGHLFPVSNDTYGISDDGDQYCVDHDLKGAANE